MSSVPTWVMVVVVLATLAVSRIQPAAVVEPEVLSAGLNANLIERIVSQDFEDMQSTKFIATGYSLGRPYSTITKAGEPLINVGFMNVGGIHIVTIAVDSEVIPLGSILFIEGVGIGLATDTGRAIKGRKIDICFQDMNAAMDWGKKTVEVYMLRKGR